MPNMLPRLLYILAALAWFLLLRPNPVTIVMAGCFACLTLPVYRRMRCTIRHWRKRLRLRHPGRLGHIVISCSHRLPLYGYIVMIFSGCGHPHQHPGAAGVAPGGQAVWPGCGNSRQTTSSCRPNGSCASRSCATAWRTIPKWTR